MTTMDEAAVYYRCGYTGQSEDNAPRLAAVAFKWVMCLAYKTAGMLKESADLSPKTLAIMHGSSFSDYCVQQLTAWTP
jgi:hypothetical protein